VLYGKTVTEEALMYTYKYQAGNLLDDFYDSETKWIRDELARLQLPIKHTNTQDAIAALDDMTRLWRNAT
jgi:hypothetical protein